MSLIDEVLERLQGLDEKTRASLTQEVMQAVGDRKWIPNPGPQAAAYHSEADVMLYGGQAGGGKSGLLVGLALNEHKRSLIMRRHYNDLNALIDDCLGKYGTRDGYSGKPPPSLRTKDGRLIEFGAAKEPSDVENWRGQPHDLLGIDEASQFLESQVRFLMGWVRSTEPGQRTRVVFASNPPDRPAEGRWLFEMFAAWLDPAHPDPAEAGELRWYISDENGEDKQVEGPEPIEVGGRLVTPQSRTFIPAALRDNPFFEGTGYDKTLDGLPEPLRSAVRDGNWMISHEDDEWQIIPTNWVLAAQKRWRPEPPREAPMTAIGVDVAQGGSAETVLAPRYDTWFARLIVVPGRETPTGSDVAALVLKHRHNEAVVGVDAGGGYGGGTIERLRDNGVEVHGFKGGNRSAARTADRQLAFYNKRAEALWRFRETLDPDQPGGCHIALPDDQELLRDLVSYRYEIKQGKIKAEDKQETKKRLGHSPDRGDALMIAWQMGPSYMTHGNIWRQAIRSFGQRQPQIVRGYDSRKRFLGMGGYRR